MFIDPPCCFGLKENNRKKKSFVFNFFGEGKVDSTNELKVHEH